MCMKEQHNICRVILVVAVRGTVNFKEDEAPKLLADSIEPLDSAAEANAEQKSETVDKNKLIKLKIPSSVDVNITIRTDKRNP